MLSLAQRHNPVDFPLVCEEAAETFGPVPKCGQSSNSRWHSARRTAREMPEAIAIRLEAIPIRKKMKKV